MGEPGFLTWPHSVLSAVFWSKGNSSGCFKLLHYFNFFLSKRILC